MAVFRPLRVRKKERQYHLLKYIMMIFCVGVIVYALPKGRKFKYEFERGKPWMHEKLIAPFDFAIEKTKDEYEQERRRRTENILPYYRLDHSVDSQIIERYQNEFASLWDTKYLEKNNSNSSSRKLNKQFGEQILKQIYQKGIIEIQQKDTSKKEFYLLNGNVSTRSAFNQHYSLKSAVKKISSTLQQKPGVDTSLLLPVLQNSLSPNIYFDEKFNVKVFEEELRSISLYKGMMKQGDLIIETGNVVDEQKYRQLESLKNEYDKRLGALGKKWIVSLGQALLVSLVLVLLMVFLAMFRKDIYADVRKMFIILVIVTLMLVTLSVALRFKLPNLYFIPYCIVPIIIRIIFDTRLALYIHLLVVIIAGFFVPNGFEFVFLQITAGIVAINSIKNLLKRSQYLISAFLIFVTYVVGFIGISIVHEGSFINIQWGSLVWFLVSVTLSLLAYPLIYAFEKLFGITSEVTLMEYTNTNNPLLRELSYKAPGTFQHSLQVANLAEAAIFEIGGNALLVRAGALYHDIGKIESPQFFIENQIKGNNPHDHLTYEESAKIIIRHVYAGVEIATKHRIPRDVIDFIRTHHGNTRVDFFYQSFLKNYPERSVNENVFRYPGPIPFSKETAVLMLADSVEAASRSLKEPSPQAINDLVERIINYKVDQQQLINSDISIKEIHRLKKIFKEMLMSIYHVRIDYQETLNIV
jgi:cyclic-di-AMP phosphodiesterase PgpH